jgi:putative transposase
VVKPDTLLRWYRTPIAKKYDGSAVRRAGRPKTADEIEQLILQMARSNPTWGYTKIRGAPFTLGHEIGRNTIKRILFDNGFAPAPLRNKGMSRTTFRKRTLGCYRGNRFF